MPEPEGEFWMGITFEPSKKYTKNYVCFFLKEGQIQRVFEKPLRKCKRIDVNTNKGLEKNTSFFWNIVSFSSDFGKYVKTQGRKFHLNILLSIPIAGSYRRIDTMDLRVKPYPKSHSLTSDKSMDFSGSGNRWAWDLYNPLGKDYTWYIKW